MIYEKTKIKELAIAELKNEYEAKLTIGCIDIDDKKDVALDIMTSGKNYKIADSDYQIFYASMNPNDKEKENTIIEALKGKNSKKVRHVYIRYNECDCKNIINKLKEYKFKCINRNTPYHYIACSKYAKDDIMPHFGRYMEGLEEFTHFCELIFEHYFKYKLQSEIIEIQIGDREDDDYYDE